MTNIPDISELERRVEFEEVAIRDDKDNFILELSYRETKGYSLAKKVEVVGEEALVHLVRNYVSPTQKAGRRSTGALPPKDWQPNLVNETFQIPKSVTSFGVGQDYWSLSGVLEYKDADALLDVGNESIKLIPSDGNLQKLLDTYMDVGEHPYNRVSVVAEERPVWPATTLTIKELNYRKNGNLAIHTAFF